MAKRPVKPRVPRTRADGNWTESRYWSFIRGHLRRAFMYYPPKQSVLAEASKKVTGKRHKTEYKCAECKKYYKKSEIEVDHIKECGPLKSAEDLVPFITTLFCEKDNLQILCMDCHQTKTNKARK